jgi:ribosomal protein S18 acetylase RimI-like enzyme
VSEVNVPAAASLRPMRWPDDEPFLHELYASTRAQELAQVPWTPEQKAQFCAMQFEAQHHHYQKHYPLASRHVIERAGVAAGRLYVDRTPLEIHIIDISLLPEHCGAGIGTRYLRELQDEAAAHGQAVSIQVEKFNPARRLYQRLGFVEKEDMGVYLLLEWRAGA